MTANLPKPAPERLPRGWPANARSFGRRIPKLKPALRANGWEIVQDEHTARGRKVYIQPHYFAGAETSATSRTSFDCSDLQERSDVLPDVLAGLASGTSAAPDPSDVPANDVTFADVLPEQERQDVSPAESAHPDVSAPMISGGLRNVRCPRCAWRFKTAVQPGETV